MTTAPARAERDRGTRSRAGNAMARTEAALVAGVGACLAAQGFRRTTMIDIAAAAGVAKGTLYNHVRTKAEAGARYAEAEAARIADLLAGDGLLAAAEDLAAHPVSARLRADEPGALALAVQHDAAVRAIVGEALADLLGPAPAELAYRWLGSLLLDPGTLDARAAAVEQIAQLAQLR